MTGSEFTSTRFYNEVEINNTGVTVSFFRAELYCSSERRGSPLGNVSKGDLVAISHTPSYHSSGHKPEEDITKIRVQKTAYHSGV